MQIKYRSKGFSGIRVHFMQAEGEREWEYWVWGGSND